MYIIQLIDFYIINLIYFHVVKLNYFNTIHTNPFIIQLTWIYFNGTALMFAVEKNNVEIVNLLLSNKNINISSQGIYKLITFLFNYNITVFNII